ncbi:MAG: patatin-like phospholipase family protein [Arenimonas sp.]|nr:patatin-like phospholipase family protein [Arenimonas sp.]
MGSGPVEVGQSDSTRQRASRTQKALCLSGGGFRAAIFHLGALLRLHQLGVLRGLDLISSVSGGSIASAWLASCYLRQRKSSAETFPEWCDRIDFHADVVEPFRTVAARDLRTLPVLLTTPWNGLWPSVRVKLLRRSYRKFLGELVLEELPRSPRFVFCATNLTFGVNWEFSRRRVGDFQSGYLRHHGRITLAEAVAASSCFPPLFGPLRFHASAADFTRGGYRGFDGDRLRARVELSDGGVYDNMGMEPAIKSCSEILVSDAGAPFAFVAGQHYFRRLLRYAGVVGRQAVALRKRLFFRSLEAGEFSGAYWNLTERGDAGAAGYSLGLCSEVLGNIRTDLDRFTSAEFCILVNHGYFSCQDGMPPREGATAAWPYPDFSAEQDVRRMLRQSHRRFFHGRWWQN